MMCGTYGNPEQWRMSEQRLIYILLCNGYAVTSKMNKLFSLNRPLKKSIQILRRGGVHITTVEFSDKIRGYVLTEYLNNVFIGGSTPMSTIKRIV